MKGYNYYKIPQILHLKPEEYSSYLVNNIAFILNNSTLIIYFIGCFKKLCMQDFKHCDDATYRYTDPKLIESVIGKVYSI